MPFKAALLPRLPSRRRLATRSTTAASVPATAPAGDGVAVMTAWLESTRRAKEAEVAPLEKRTRTSQVPAGAEPAGEPPLARRRLPDERRAITHKFSIGGHEGYMTVGMYDDGMPGELFVVMAKEGSVVSGLMDSFATSISMALQYGVPLRVLVDKFSHTRFEPSGFTGNPEIPIAKSITDYIFRWLSLKFLPSEE